MNSVSEAEHKRRRVSRAGIPNTIDSKFQINPIDGPAGMEHMIGEKTASVGVTMLALKDRVNIMDRNEDDYPSTAE